MSNETTITGGCLCGAIRYEAHCAPLRMGFCYCGDCRKASGSGFIPFMRFEAKALSFKGTTKIHTAKSMRGNDAHRNFCPDCGGLVFGGIVGKVEFHTIYAGSLDDPTHFKPSMAIFLRDKPDWVLVPPGLTTFETMPG